MQESDSKIIETLNSYKKLSGNHKAHEQLIKDKVVILYAATLLENKNADIVQLCLDIFNNLVGNEVNHPVLLTTFGIFEAIESLSIKVRSSHVELSDYASDIIERLRKSAPPAYSTRQRLKNNRNFRKITYMYLFYIGDLNELNRRNFDETLLEIKGIVSFVVDMEQRRCTIRIGPKVNIKNIVAKINSATGLKVLLVKKNRSENSEEYVDILEDHNRTIASPEYFPEEETPPKGKSLTKISNITKNAGSWLKSAVDSWNKSFYW